MVRQKEINLQATQVAGLHNVTADSLLRQGQAQTSEWSQSEAEFNRVTSFWGTPEIDILTTAANRVAKNFLSPVPR